MKSFENYLRDHTILKETSIYKYVTAINTISSDMINEKVIRMNINDITQINDFEIIYHAIMSSSKFIKKNNKGNNMYSCALKYYQKYLEFINKYFY